VGGVISPLLANVYLHALNVAWETRGRGVLVRYADDLVVMCRSRLEAETALGTLRVLLAELALTPNEAKTRILQVDEDGDGFDFLGFEHHWVRGKWPRTRHIAFLARWPSRKAMAHARERLRELTARERQRLSVEQVVQEVNRFLRGWAAYFRYGNSARHFDLITYHARQRLAIFLATRRAWSRRQGWVVASRSGWLGLVSLRGTVASPRPNRGWRVAGCRR